MVAWYSVLRILSESAIMEGQGVAEIGALSLCRPGFVTL